MAVIWLFAAAALVSAGGNDGPVRNANAAIKIVRQQCGKHHVYVFGKWHAKLEGPSWTVWFGKEAHVPSCNSEAASVATDGSKTTCDLIVVC
jgi:hypothetical protein